MDNDEPEFWTILKTPPPLPRSTWAQMADELLHADGWQEIDELMVREIEDRLKKVSK